MANHATTAAAWLLALLLLPALLLLWATESRGQRLRRQRAAGATWAALAARHGCSPSTARRWAQQP
jgi:hypothetical protein